MSYGGNRSDSERTVGLYTRVFQCAKPSDLPVQQTTKVELIHQPQDRKGDWCHHPLSLRGRANEVIE